MRLELPGFFDVQVNGFAGVDFNSATLTAGAIDEALARMRESGVTRCLPTIITSSFDRFAACVRPLARHRSTAIVGIHMEGPYLSAEDGYRGAHLKEHVVPASIDDFERRQEAADGRIVLVTLAAEAPGATALIEHAVRTGIRAAIGHSAASPSQIADAIAAGATMATHLGNGCAAMLPRHPNVIWELLAADDVVASVIADGHHLPPSTLKSIVRAKGKTRTILVTDAVAAAAAPPGRYTIGDVVCESDGHGRVSMPGSPYLAGSSLTLDRAIANTVKFTGLSIDDVVPMASTIPAASLGMTPLGTVSADWDPERAELSVRGVTTS